MIVTAVTRYRRAGREPLPPRAAERAGVDGRGQRRPLYCPFEADWYAHNKGSPVGFDAGEGHVLTTEEYLPGAVEWGTCPHRAMRTLAHSADVVIGNYNHQSFDLLVESRNVSECVLPPEQRVAS
jgi:DNA excision repair protein ERCC-2